MTLSRTKEDLKKDPEFMAIVDSLLPIFRVSADGKSFEEKKAEFFASDTEMAQDEEMNAVLDVIRERLEGPSPGL
jgi:hypothetical protein